MTRKLRRVTESGRHGRRSCNQGEDWKEQEGLNRLRREKQPSEGCPVPSGEFYQVTAARRRDLDLSLDPAGMRRLGLKAERWWRSLAHLHVRGSNTRDDPLLLPLDPY
jgi:hypothetical protein